ncbi:heavy-metal-associated domain-containing protein [Segetibacter koreensis]|uniref:heavy-metal-associated domain-containing protein n=1 Tax=Segetibacter koreensis TaxID=398037 RepID=UPI00037F23AC|nr:heavy-metal-associated domain-containing protein [Segetibacter koreensis]
MKTIFLFIAIVLSVATKAQVSKVSLQASGLTCSMCSNSINKALKTLDFVDKVDADIRTYTFEISFKPNSNVDFDKIKSKVEKAGFSVSSFVATILFNNVQVRNNNPVTIGDKTFLFVKVKDQLLNGLKQVKVLDKGFVSQKENKVYSFSALSPQTFHATI